MVHVAAIAGVKFAEGTDTVPAMLSPGEMIIPRRFADAIRTGDLILSGRGYGGRNTSFGDINVNIYGASLASGQDVSELAEQLGFEIDRQLRYNRGF